MLYTPFANFSEFRAMFGNQNNRKNSILLAAIKCKGIRWEFAQRGKMREMTTIAKMREIIVTASINIGSDVRLLGREWSSSEYRTDKANGNTFKVDKSNMVAVISKKTGKTTEIKASKLYCHLLRESWLKLPEKVVNYLAEELAAEWQAEQIKTNYTLIIDDDFEAIYDSSNYVDAYFDSCMTDEYRHAFYENAIDASAARIVNTEGKIMARAIIYNHVRDTATGEVLRICERQYGANDLSKLALIKMLIDAKAIDAYKKVGAGCGEVSAFVGINGDDLSEHKLEIDCNLETDDTLSYQDSFIWYDIYHNVAYNHSNGGKFDYKLDTVDPQLAMNYDEYHEEYTIDDCYNVRVNGRWMTCSCERLNDFVLTYSDVWVHYEDAARCPICDEWEEIGDMYYLAETEEYYCCHECFLSAAREWCEANEGYYFDEDIREICEIETEEEEEENETIQTIGAYLFAQ